MLSQLLTMTWMSLLLNTVYFTLHQFIVYFQNLTFRIGFVIQFSDLPASENIWGRWKITEFLSTNNDMKVVVFIFGLLYSMSINILFQVIAFKNGFSKPITFSCTKISWESMKNNCSVAITTAVNSHSKHMYLMFPFETHIN